MRKCKNDYAQNAKKEMINLKKKKKKVKKRPKKRRLQKNWNIEKQKKS